MTASQFIIGAISSGSGKTTLTLGLLRALRNRGLKTQPFKCGPDYIDPQFHRLASGRQSVNLDLFLSSEEHVTQTYAKHASECDAVVVEGVMGLFDGYKKWHGSAAQIAQLLNIPIVLVLTPKAMAYTVAPILHGLKSFMPGIRIVGVIFNMVNSENHYSFLKDACMDAGITPLGYLHKNEEIALESRHLGLNIGDDTLKDSLAEKASHFIEQHIDVDLLIKLILIPLPPYLPKPTSVKTHFSSAVAYDEAFNFIYHENIEYLKRHGEVQFFSPLDDKRLPEADIVYFPGGYPELYAEKLASNESMKQSIRQFAHAGGRILAECGGMMYLSSQITTQDGIAHPMVGIFEQNASMEKARLKLGYRHFNYNGTQARGHEFHYSEINSTLPSCAQQFNARGEAVETKLLHFRNVIAGYTHLYWAEWDNLLDFFKTE